MFRVWSETLASDCWWMFAARHDYKRLDVMPTSARGRRLHTQAFFHLIPAVSRLNNPFVFGAVWRQVQSLFRVTLSSHWFVDFVQHTELKGNVLKTRTLSDHTVNGSQARLFKLQVTGRRVRPRAAAWFPADSYPFHSVSSLPAE